MKKVKQVAISFDDVDRWHGMDILPAFGMLWLGTKMRGDEEDTCTVNPQTAERFIKNLTVMEAIGQPITVLMHNFGGEVYSGFAIYDAIRNCKVPIQIIVVGAAMSMGSIILQAADKRIMTPNARIMIHDGYSSISGTPKNVEAQASEVSNIRKIFYKIYSGRTGLSEKDFDKWCSVDTYINAEEALSLGMIDEIRGMQRERVKSIEKGNRKRN